MQFRYKVKKCYINNIGDSVTHYYVHIQTLNSKGTRWKRFSKADLKDIVERVTNTEFGTTKRAYYELNEDYLRTCLWHIKANGGIDKVMTNWIQSILKEMSDDELKNQHLRSDITELDKMLLSDSWKVIDVNCEE